MLVALQLIDLTYLEIVISDLVFENIPDLQASVRWLVRLDLLSL